MAKTVRVVRGDVVKATRENQGLTQEQVCDKAKISSKTLSRMEAGKATVPSLRSVADVLDIPYESLLFVGPSAQADVVEEDQLDAYGVFVEPVPFREQLAHDREERMRRFYAGEPVRRLGDE